VGRLLENHHQDTETTKQATGCRLEASESGRTGLVIGAVETTYPQMAADGHRWIGLRV
jgi:hypothetical protein